MYFKSSAKGGYHNYSLLTIHYSLENFCPKSFPQSLWTVNHFLLKKRLRKNYPHPPVENHLFIHSRLWIHKP